MRRPPLKYIGEEIARIQHQILEKMKETLNNPGIAIEIHDGPETSKELEELQYKNAMTRLEEEMKKHIADEASKKIIQQSQRRFYEERQSDIKK